MLFLNVTAEEKGLLGSEYYAAKPLYPLAKTVADINMDSLDPTGPAKNWSQSGSAKSELLDLLIADAKAGGLCFSPDTHPESGSFFRSDHFSFAKRGVPALSFESGNDLVNGGTAAGEAQHKEYNSQALPSAVRRMAGELDVRRHAARPRDPLQGRHGTRRFGEVAELVAGFGIPRHARRDGRRAQVIRS